MRRTTIMLLVAIATLLSAQSFSAMEYYPMAVGYVWSYLDTVNGTETIVSTVRITQQTVIDSYPAWEFVTTQEGSDTSDTTYTQLREDGFYQFVSIPILGEQIIKFLPITFALGDTWQAVVIDTSMDTMGSTVNLHIELYGSAENLENVSTIAGDFDNCVRVIYTSYVDISVPPYYEGSDTIVTNEIWLAHSVGRVRSIFRNPDPMSSSESHSWLREYDLTKIAETPLPQSVKFEAYPNPFNSACVIRTPAGADKIAITDISGRTVAEIDHPGIIAFWKPSADTPAGIYLAHAVSDGKIIATQKIMFVK